MGRYDDSRELDKAAIKKLMWVQDQLDFLSLDMDICPSCEGNGKSADGNGECSLCLGNGYIELDI